MEGELILSVYFVLLDSTTENPSQNRDLSNANTQSYSFKMLESALQEGPDLLTWPRLTSLYFRRP